jgi:Zn-finger nucleic acid-binding protein
MSERNGVEIDYCPDCRGIWLDRGKLDKIVERSFSPSNQSSQYSNEDNQTFNRSQESDNEDSQGSRSGRKRNFFSELFD